MKILLVVLVVISLSICNAAAKKSSKSGDIPSNAAKRTGDDWYKMAEDLMLKKDYVTAGTYYFNALAGRAQKVSREELFSKYMRSFQLRGVIEEGYLSLAEQYIKQSDIASSKAYIEQSLQVKETARAYLLYCHIYNGDDISSKQQKLQYLQKAVEIGYKEKNADTLVRCGHVFYELKLHKMALDMFEAALVMRPDMDDAYAISVYLRSNLFYWGEDGHLYDKSMRKLESIVNKEMRTSMLHNDLSQQSALHPHMALGYDIDPYYKLMVAKSHSRAEEVLVYNAGFEPYNHTAKIPKYLKESKSPKFRIKVGYLSANFKSKTTVYMAQDLLGLHDRSKFEIHVFATSDQDNANFLKYAMRGVDWRAKIASSVEHFHDVHTLDVKRLFEKIRSLGIHILLNWDGYSNNGVRAAGIFPMRPAPIQIAHQEYIGTMGADYIQYIITDKTTSPLSHSKYYTEKFIYMPHCFLANSFPLQAPHMTRPAYKTDVSYLNAVLSAYTIDADTGNNANELNVDETKDKTITTRFYQDYHSRYPSLDQGDGEDFEYPKELRDITDEDMQKPFVFCNFNKQLKFSPRIVKLWLKVMKKVKNSKLFLLENPKDSIEFVYDFIKNFDEKLAKRVYFEKFLANPYDNQFRTSRLCDVILDTPTYNSHTTAIDALYGGTLLVTLGNDLNMAGRVGMSVLKTLNLSELIAKDDDDFVRIASKLGQDRQHYFALRARLVQLNLERRPRSAYWNLEQYARDLEDGFTQIWNHFINGRGYQHVVAGSGGSQSEISQDVEVDPVIEERIQNILSNNISASKSKNSNNNNNNKEIIDEVEVDAITQESKKIDKSDSEEQQSKASEVVKNSKKTFENIENPKKDKKSDSKKKTQNEEEYEEEEVVVVKQAVQTKKTREVTPKKKPKCSKKCKCKCKKQCKNNKTPKN